MARVLETGRTQRSAFAYFSEAFRRAPIRTTVGLLVEYGMFAAAVFLALLLFVTRIPLGFLDRTLGLGLRERFVDLLARVSPG